MSKQFLFNRRATLVGLGLTTMAGISGCGRDAKDKKVADLRNAKASGFHVPDEAGPHERTFMQWPARGSIHGGRRELKRIRQTIADIANAIIPFEPVIMLCRPEQMWDMRTLLDPKVDAWPIPTDDLWARDAGPLFVKNAEGELAISNLNFDGWGKKQEHGNDASIAAAVAKKLNLPIFNNGVVGEAGGVETDGTGTLIAHASSWRETQRNGTLTQDEIGKLLLQAFGADKIIWAPGVQGEDITDYHIDALARFIEPGKILIQLPKREDRHDPFSIAAFETYDILKAARDAQGNQFELIVVEEPKRTRSRDMEFVSAYPNYYICNGAVISAQFGDDKADKAAGELLKELYPNREIVALNVDPLAEAGGGIHCATQQQPKVESGGAHDATQNV